MGLEPWLNSAAVAYRVLSWQCPPLSLRWVIKSKAGPRESGDQLSPKERCSVSLVLFESPAKSLFLAQKSAGQLSWQHGAEGKDAIK